MSVEHSPFEQIVNVEWEEEQDGAIFVAAGSEFILYAKIEGDDIAEMKDEDYKGKLSDKIKFKDLGSFAFYNPYEFAGIGAGSYMNVTKSDDKTKTPTFIVGGFTTVQD